jgi:hypothetical protein
MLLIINLKLYLKGFSHKFCKLNAAPVPLPYNFT